MDRIQKITAIICALALVISSFGTYAGNAKAASLPVTADDASPIREVVEQGAAKTPDTKKNAKQLQLGKKTQGRLVTGDDGQSYQITLKSSGQLDIHLEGAAGKLATRLTDKDGKGWAPRRKTSDGKQTYQLKKGTYYYQVQIAKSAQIPETGLGYAVTATFQSAQARFEGNDTRKKAVKMPSNEIFYGHLAQNAPVEYYKFTLKTISRITFCVATQITDYTPETYVVTLYNKNGNVLSSWENEDLVKLYGEEYRFGNDWWWWDWTRDINGEMGLHEVVPAGTYYVGVSVKRDSNGKIPSSARYGKYAVRTVVAKQGLSVELSKKQAEYTGKKIKHPKVTIKKNFKKAYYQDWEKDDSQSLYSIVGMSEGLFPSDGYIYDTIKGIGRYMVSQERWWVSPDLDAPDATTSYAIFTVTPIRGKINRISSKKKGQIQVSVKKNAQSTGYQIQIARDKKFKKSVKTLKAAGTRKTIKGLSHGKKYYVRVRNYKDVKTYYCDIAVPESIYGKWSKVRTVVCK